jgi:hypothetical protein
MSLNSRKQLKGNNITLKVLRFYVFQLLYSSLIKKGNKALAFSQIKAIMFALKKKLKKRKPFNLIFLAVSNLRPPFEYSHNKKG